MFPARRTSSLAVALLAATLAIAPATAHARVTPHISFLRCLSPVCTKDPHAVRPGGRLLVAGRHLARGMAVVFPRLHKPGGKAYAVTRLHTRGRYWSVVVPSSATSGRIYIQARNGARSNRRLIRILAVKPPRPAPGSAPATGTTAAGLGAALSDQGVWIWYVSASSGGNLDAIAARARASRVGTVYVKSSDGTNAWGQFNPALVQGLKARGLHVCAWQFVYGSSPSTEADLGAQAQRAGAECLVIDAESSYEGRYISAQTYIRRLRAQVGADYPVALTSFPYVDYHPSLPFSVFLGPDGAQANLPQMYWKDIGVSVDTVYAHTYLNNTIYRRPILPLGQAYSHPSRRDLLRFRQLAANYGAPGISFWDWQENDATGWGALAAGVGPDPSYAPVAAMPVLARGSKGDEVVWLQQHLATEQPSVTIDGDFGPSTASALRTFQGNHGLPQTGQSDAATWNALLAVAPTNVQWKRGAKGATVASAAKRGSVRVLPPPRSATLRSRDELHGHRPGEGRP